MSARPDGDLGDGLAREAHKRYVIERGHHLSVDDSVDRQPRLHGVLVRVDGRQGIMEIGDVHFGQKAQFAEINAQHWSPLPVRQAHGAQHCAVSAKAHDEVCLLRQRFSGDCLSRTPQPRDLRFDAEHPDRPASRPVKYGVDGLG